MKEEFLYDMSDHLPVILEIEIEQMTLNQKESTLYAEDLVFENPVKDHLNLRLRESTLATTMQITDMQGRTVFTEDF